MVIRIVRTILVCAGVLILGSCDVIFGSVFPATLTLAKAQADLSKLIPAGNNGSFNIRVVESGSNGYVVVSGSVQGSAPSMFIYDVDLNLKKSLTGATAPTGTGVMVGANGRINAGGVELDPTNLSTVATAAYAVSNNGYMGVDGFVMGGADYFGYNFQMGNSTLNYSVNGAGTSSLQFSSAMSNLQVDAVFDDSPGDDSGQIIFVISQSNNNNNNSDDATRYFVRILKSTYISTGLTSLQNILDDPQTPRRDKLARDSLGFADGSIMAYDNGSSSYVRIDPTDGSIQDSFKSSSSKDARFAYRVSGREFYGFDRKSRILTKYVAWW